MKKQFLRVNILRKGHKIIIRNEPYLVEFYKFYNPGKGKSLVTLKLRHFIKNSLIETTFKSNELVEIANIYNKECKYLYNDKINWYFITNKDYKIIFLYKDIVEQKKIWLISEMIYSIFWLNKKIIGLNIPNFIIMQIIDLEYNETNKKNVINNNFKLATISNGIKIKVPFFIRLYDFIKIDTRLKIYVNRINK